MAHRSDDDVELVRSGGSPLVDEDTPEKNVSLVYNENEAGGGNDAGDELSVADNVEEDANLPQCKIKRNYSCNLCPFFSQNPRSFLYHSRDVHFDRIRIYECSYCLYASKHSQKLQRHVNMIHVAGKNRLKRGSRLTTRELRPIRPKPPQTKTNTSPEEDTKANEQDDSLVLDLPPQIRAEEEAEIEEEIVDGEFKCSLCSFRNKNQKLMRRHEKVVHLKKRFLRCNKCSYVTHVKARYTKHVKYHSMPMIKCDLCDFRTPYKWNLDRHYKNHCGSGAFQCSKCNFRADIKQSLTVHEMNHHVPPVGQGAITARKRNKVGGSEISSIGSDTAGKEKPEAASKGDGDGDTPPNQKQADAKEDQKREKRTGVQSNHNLKSSHGNKRESTANSHLQADFIHPDDVVPRYGQIFVKNLKCKFCSYKAVFSHEIWRHEKRIHGFIRPENKKENAPKRPPPKLIPIQNKVPPAGPISSPILKIPEVKNKPTSVLFQDSSPSVDKSVNENEFNEMCKKSCLTSSLKDFVSLIGDEEGLKTIPDSSREDLEEECSVNKSETVEDFESKANDLAKQKQTDLLKKKNASFFDKLKEKLLTGSNEEQSLFCEECAHESKCLSEAVAHQKRHTNANNKSEFDGPSESDVVVLGVKLSSTRCQHCRQRCKTSTDLFNHLKSCKAIGAAQESQTPLEEYVDREIKCEMDQSDREEKQDENEKSMENRVFVWNDLGRGLDEDEEEDEEEEDDDEEGDGLDIDIPSNEDIRTDSDSMSGMAVDKDGENSQQYVTFTLATDPRLRIPVKNVFKCPHCSFWASTASRFHVHIVGHLNKKPFECSLCMYRSNWRWDITKHIRLKSARDPSHLEARVNMTDETGRRNYSKYSKYLTLMKVQEPSAESSGTGRRTRPTDITQGNVSEKDVITLPALPRLTRAPTPGTSNQVPEGLPLRPPPLLKAAHQISSGLLPEDDSEGSPDSKKTAKKTLWKCKRCDFRDSDKQSVLSHVKQHYGKKKKNLSRAKITSVKCSANSNLPQDAPTHTEEEEATRATKSSSKISFKEISYKCGHCHQASPWKHVIQRHCRLKHNGNALIEVGWRHEADASSRNKKKILSDTVSADDVVELFLCDICPFTTDSEGNLTAHKLNHKDRPGSIFKCTYCPFYVPSKIAVLEHMQLHGVFGSRFKIPANSDDFDEDSTTGSSSNDSQVDIPTQTFTCTQCPYVTNMKTQFLYHKHLHIPRDTPFKCKYCSFNVSRPHLLREHLKVHSVVVTTESSDEVADENVKETTTLDPKSKVLAEIDQVALHDIPLVWVFRAGSWKKMYKCRHCPHLNARKTNIQEHEKMHQVNEIKSDGESGNSELRCPDCNYTCNNPGVLASHTKVHQEDYGVVRCLVDRDRSDAEQIQELQMNLRAEEGKGVTNVDKVDGEDEKPRETDKSVQDDFLSFQPENAYRRTTNREEGNGDVEKGKKLLSFCDKCPARFFFEKELQIHLRFHDIHLPFRCIYCTYTARQRPHLLAHYKVHSQEYKEKTEQLINTYDVSDDCPQPPTAVITKDSRVIEGPVWMVITYEEVKEKSKDGGIQNKLKYACHRCPSSFFKFVALKYHLSLHGSSHQYKCKYCDYSVKTQGNLTKHQLLHEKEEPKPSVVVTPVKSPQRSNKESVLRRTDTRSKSDDSETQKKSSSLSERAAKVKEDPQLESLMHGSPEFIYPTYLKNGKVREKKYKCHKCPSAFEKRDQYRIHISLHGSKQKYECKKCDYSVKYYANYSQHLRKHVVHEEAMKERELKTKNQDEEKSKTAVEDVTPEIKVEQKELNYDLTLNEQQTVLLQEKKTESEGKEEEKKFYYCQYCPYVNNRRDNVSNHSRRHFRVSGTKSGYRCPHCDYSANQVNFLREHVKIHFGRPLWKAEAFLKCEKMELWCSLDKNKDEVRISEPKMLVFQDWGEEAEDRFFPRILRGDPEDDEDDWRIYVNPETGQPVGEDYPFYAADNAFPVCQRVCYDLVEMVQVQMEDPSEEEEPSPKKRKTKMKSKRLRGKNWKCKKCPHAFGKRDQYLRHAALHGSNQRHKCDICDYSVKFYTNYVQHMRMHQSNEPNKIIVVKKYNSLEETAAKDKIAVSRSTQSEHPEKNSEAKDVQTETILQQEDKTTASKYDETDQEYSSLTDGTEMSISSGEYGPSAEEDEHLQTKMEVDGVSLRS